MEKIKVEFIKAMHPYRAWEIGLMKAEIAWKWENKGYIKIIKETKSIQENNNLAWENEPKNKSMQKRKKKKNKDLTS